MPSFPRTCEVSSATIPILVLSNFPHIPDHWAITLRLGQTITASVELSVRPAIRIRSRDTTTNIVKLQEYIQLSRQSHPWSHLRLHCHLWRSSTALSLIQRALECYSLVCQNAFALYRHHSPKLFWDTDWLFLQSLVPLGSLMPYSTSLSRESS